MLLHKLCSSLKKDNDLLQTKELPFTDIKSLIFKNGSDNLHMYAHFIILNNFLNNLWQNKNINFPTSTF